MPRASESTGPETDTMKIADLLTNSVRRFPERTAVTHDDRQITFRQLHRQAAGLADHLRQLSVPRGARIAVLFENSIEYVTAFFAVTMAGYVVVPLDTSLDAGSLRFVLSDCEAHVLMAGFRFRKILTKIVEDGTPVDHIITDRPLTLPSGGVKVELLSDIIKPEQQTTPSEDTGSNNAGPDDQNDEGQLAAIFYTSGSTGKPKGVMLSHRNLVSNTLATIDYLSLTDTDSVMVILPFYYIYGNSLLLTHIACGGRLVIDNRFLYPEVILDTMEKENTTGFSGVPSNFMILLGNSTFTKRRLESLRYLTQAGGAMAPEVTRKLMDAFPAKEIFIMYGQTEAAPRVTWLPPEKLKEKLGSIGIPVPGVEVYIVDDDGNELPPEQVGQIMVVGPNVMLGYWNQADEEREVLREGRLFTGDLARKDHDGYIWVVGRKKEIIKTGGNRVSVKEIEECILEHDKVLETAVFGVDDPVLGEAIKTVVVPKPGSSLTAKEVSDFCRSRLAQHKIPKFIDFADALPKQKSGKVDKLKLKSQQQTTIQDI